MKQKGGRKTRVRENQKAVGCGPIQGAFQGSGVETTTKSSRNWQRCGYLREISLAQACQPFPQL